MQNLSSRERPDHLNQDDNQQNVRVNSKGSSQRCLLFSYTCTRSVTFMALQIWPSQSQRTKNLAIQEDGSRTATAPCINYRMHCLYYWQATQRIISKEESMTCITKVTTHSCRHIWSNHTNLKQQEKVFLMPH